jgi:phosphatidylserine/phosphatidylglycerophosphate/cardiolipin synthase-like enzyme
MDPAPFELVTLTQGGQQADDIAARLEAFLLAAERTLDLALYDVRLPGPVGDRIAAALRGASERGVRVRIAIQGPDAAPPGHTSPPPQTRPDILANAGGTVRAIDGDGDLMHHKYVVRDGAGLWTGSTNWTLDSWTLQENVIVTTESPGLAAAFERDFEGLWSRGHLEGGGGFDGPRVAVGDAFARPWFCPGRGRELAHQIAARIDRAERRIRICSPVLTSAPVLAALADVVAEQRVDATGVVDRTQTNQALRQWRSNPHAGWKIPVLEQVLDALRFAGKHSTPWSPQSTHDFMHAKTSVIDDVVFIGSYNLSRSGEENAENVLEIEDAALADRVATWIDGVRERYAEPSKRP